MGTRWRPSDVCLINPSNYKICLSEMCVCLVVNQLSQVCGTTLYYECGKSGKNMEMQVTQTSDMSNHAICNNQKKCACLMEYTLLQSNMAMENPLYIDVCFKHVLFSIIYGLSSFPLTNSYFSRWLKPPTSIDVCFQLLIFI